MTQSLIAPATATASFLECGPVALWRRYSSSGISPTPRVVRFVLDYIMGAFLVAGAAEVLVPAGMVHWMERNTAGEPRGAWEMLARDHRLVVLATCGEIGDILDCYSSYHTFCIPVPGGPLSSKLLFRRAIDVYYGDSVKKMMDMFRSTGASSCVSWRAWMRSGLTCPFEGHYVPPIRVSEYAASLLSAEGGCTQIILEEGSAGLTPRWLETSLKTALSCGIPTSCMSLALCDAAHTPKLVGKALEVGVQHLCTSSLGREFALFEKSDPLVPIDAISLLVSHIAELNQASLSDAELDQLHDSAAFVESVRKQWLKETEMCIG
ncbi:unnamed protein product [Phytomonas sp. EM1]|nr:unnamed protein product [Phytomonas sp. EM1]|eukprot:CCW62436.1 unnamed protein product [Phytomonas sp. isolate EM1]